MATRFYLNNVIPPAIDFDLDAGWEFTGAVTVNGHRRRMWPWRNAFELTSSTQGETSTTNARDAVLVQFVSQPLAAQTIAGTLAGAFFARENNASANMISQFTARVVAPDGTVRGTLVPLNTTTTVANEWIASTTNFWNTRFPSGSNGTTVTSVSAQDGDLVVVEVGWRALNTSATAFNGTIQYGGGWRDTDIPQSEATVTNTEENPWIEFSQNLTFLDTPATVSNSAAGAPDVMPAPLSEIEGRTTDFTTLTFDAGEPDELETIFGASPRIGWLKLVGDDTIPASISLWLGAGYDIFPDLYVYDETPTDTSVRVAEYHYWEVDEGPLQISVPAGETWYVAVTHFNYIPAGTDANIEVLVRRTDSGPPTGDIKDDIVDAVDRFPSAVGTELVSETTNLAAFTTEADDPSEIATYTFHDIGYTGWLKLVVPETALTTISIEPATQPIDLVFLLYDETPTAASEAILFDDDSDPNLDANWPRFSEITLSAGTYYLCVTVWEGPDWNTGEGGYVGVKVRWELPPTDFDFNLDAVVLRTWLPPAEPRVATIVARTGTSVNDAESITLTKPGSAIVNDLLIANISWDMEGNSFARMQTPAGWTHVTSNFLPSDQALSTFEHRVDSNSPSSWDFTSFTSPGLVTPFSSAKAGEILCFRRARVVNVEGASASATSSTTHGSHQLAYLSNNPNFDLPALFVGVFAGSVGGVHSWSYSGSRATFYGTSSAANWASIASFGYEDNRDGFVPGEPISVSPAQPMLVTTLIIQGETTEFALRAFIGRGGRFTMNAVIAEVFHTTHLRTGPHYGTHPSDAIVSSALLGSLPPGTDLNTVLADLDAKLTDLERKEMP